MGKRWTEHEEHTLFVLVRSYYSVISSTSVITVESAFITSLLEAFHAQTGNTHRDASALLFQLDNYKLLTRSGGFQRGKPIDQTFKCAINEERKLYDFTVCPSRLRQPLAREIEDMLVNDFSSHMASTDNLDTVLEQLAKKYQLTVSRVTKVLFDKNSIELDSSFNYRAKKQVKNKARSHIEYVKKQKAPAKVIHAIRECQQVASELYAVHEREGAEIVFSSDGTGFGKSYGVIQSYADYLTRFKKQHPKTSEYKKGFTNLIFITPQKSQIALAEKHIDTIKALDGEFLCILARKDITNLEFVDWATKETNDTRYQRWYEGGKKSRSIAEQLHRLHYFHHELTRVRKVLAQLKHSGENGFDDKETLEQRIKGLENGFIQSILSACETLVTGKNTNINDYLRKGIAARKQRLAKEKKTGKSAILKVDEVYLEIIKQVLPFEICQFIPSVLLLTTNKFDTTTKRRLPKKRGEGFILQDVSFDYIIGGKTRPKELKISQFTGKPHAEQLTYLKNTHFAPNTACPFQDKAIRFTLVIDELHESYQRLADSCHVKLVSKKNNLAHVFSVLYRIIEDVHSLIKRKVSPANYTHFEEQSKHFVDTLQKHTTEQTDLSPQTTLNSFLSMFSNQLGAFEVNSNDAERIIAITRNIFSFNAKLFVNEEALKQIRLRNPNGNITRTELYYEVADADDTNPTLHDLFQIVSVILASCSEISDRDYKRWIKTGGQELADSQNSPLGAFIDAANSVSDEIKHVFERHSDENQPIDHFYTYLQPKTVFTMTPVNELNYRNRGAEKTVILAFEMDVIKELPEAMLLRLLSKTHNKVIALSATSGFSNTKNGAFNKTFLKRYAQDLGYRVISREKDSIPILQALRDYRSQLRKVTFTVFNTEQPRLTDVKQYNLEFAEVYGSMLGILSKELCHKQGDKTIESLKNPFKKRQIFRELEGLLLAAWEQKNTLILALSADFQKAFIAAYQHNCSTWHVQYRMHSCCENETGQEKHHKILEFTPFKNGQIIRLVFFDAALAKVVDVKQETIIRDANTTLVFMSTYNSAGTGLNYYVHYQAQTTTTDQANVSIFNVDVDFQRLILINSSWYSEVKDASNTFNTLPNLITLQKHFADDETIHLLKDLSVNFADGENYRLLMAEHVMSLFKVIVQAIGRVERCDSWLNTEVMLPNDIMDNTTFQFSNLAENSENKVVLESMSLLNNELRKKCEIRVQKGSFSSLSERADFEKKILIDSQRIDDTLKRVLKGNFINQVRRGDLSYLTTCNLFRTPLSFSDPHAWLDKLKADQYIKKNPHFQRILDSMFISPQQKGKMIRLCHKRAADGLPDKNRFALSDFSGGARCYEPELTIFPQYSKLATRKNTLVSQIIKYFANIQTTAFTELVPSPALIPLLKGNVGENIFDRVLKHYKIDALSDQHVFAHLEPMVYEFFDRFIEVDDGLVCVDVKNWSTQLDNLQRAEETVEKSQRKIHQVRKMIQKTIQEMLGKQYKWVKFVYLNTAYSKNPNNLMSQDNAEHSVYYLNLFREEHQYQIVKTPPSQSLNAPQDEYQDQTTTFSTVRSRLNCELIVTPMLKSLLGC